MVGELKGGRQHVFTSGGRGEACDHDNRYCVDSALSVEKSH